MMSEEKAAYKVKNQSGGAWSTYRNLVYGDQPLGKILYVELCTLLFGSLPGPLGYVLRGKLYPSFFASCGKKVVFGRNLTLRHSHKIRLGDRVILDDQVVLDAKGTDNRGITLGEGGYVGRNSILYCKGGDIELGPRVNFSANCTVFSSNSLTIGEGCMIAAYCYLLSGGEYDLKSDLPFADQNGMETRGPCSVGKNCWLGARVTVLDGSRIGDHSVIAASAVVKGFHPEHSLLGGIPAKPLHNSSE